MSQAFKLEYVVIHEMYGLIDIYMYIVQLNCTKLVELCKIFDSYFVFVLSRM